ncbi:MAG: sugar ABC transporter permease [Clostridiaceae bacterium]|jgi:multiple sugar transport system permease protein|nr:sugar ABC transporter permease [Clostridiaceae bacterium]
MKKSKVGFLFILPWLTGLVLFTVVPIIAALYISMTDWSIIGDANFIGLDNFKAIFNDPMFYRTLLITVRYAIFAIPLTIVTALVVAISLNNQYRGTGVFRTIFYMPSIVSGVAVAIVFKWILDPNYGVLNSLLRLFGIPGPNWLYDPDWVLPSYLIMAIWGASGGLYVYLAALKDIPKELYESAIIDGAGLMQKIRYITLPMLTPVLFYNMVMGIISAFRKFTDAYILGGAGEEGIFYMVYLYNQAFSFYKMGYATALAWILFVIIFGLTLIVNYTKKYWVFSE